MRVEIETQSMDVGFVRLPLPAVRCVVSRPCGKTDGPGAPLRARPGWCACSRALARYLQVISPEQIKGKHHDFAFRPAPLLPCRGFTGQRDGKGRTADTRVRRRFHVPSSSRAHRGFHVPSPALPSASPRQYATCRCERGAMYRRFRNSSVSDAPMKISAVLLVTPKFEEFVTNTIRLLSNPKFEPFFGLTYRPSRPNLMGTNQFQGSGPRRFHNSEKDHNPPVTPTKKVGPRQPRKAPRHPPIFCHRGGHRHSFRFRLA
jgi:hypothetical protein